MASGPFWITRCQIRRFGREELFASITKIHGPFDEHWKAHDALYVHYPLEEQTRLAHPQFEGADTWTEYWIFSDEQIAREMRLLQERLNRG